MGKKLVKVKNLQLLFVVGISYSSKLKKPARILLPKERKE